MNISSSLSARLIGVTLGLASVCSFSAGRAEKVRLSWRSEEKSCPDQRTLETSIEARLGYSPFDSHAGPEVRARVDHQGDGLTGTVEAFDASGARTGRRVFDSPTADCSELAASMELAITLAIDPLAMDRPAPVPKADAAPPPAPAPATPSEPVHFAAAAFIAGDLGLSPAPTGGVALQLVLRYRALELLLEGWAELPSSAKVIEGGTTVGTARTDLLAGSLLVCGVYRFIGVCGVGAVGALQVEGDIHGTSTRQTVVVPLAGARVRGIFELGPVSLQPFVEADFVLDRVTVETGTTTVWVTPSFAGRLGLAVALRFF